MKGIPARLSPHYWDDWLRAREVAGHKRAREIGAAALQRDRDREKRLHDQAVAKVQAKAEKKAARAARRAAAKARRVQRRQLEREAAKRNRA